MVVHIIKIYDSLHYSFISLLFFIYILFSPSPPI